MHGNEARSSARSGLPGGIGLYTPDAGEAADFYRALFNWDIASSDSQTEISAFSLGSGMIANVHAAVGRSEDSQHFAGWQISLSVSDVDTALGKVEENGGKIVIPRTKDGEGDKRAVVRDSTGARLGVIEDRGNQGFSAFGPGLPVWHEVLVTDFEEGMRFYRDVFGWECRLYASEGKTFPYATNRKGESSVCGIGDASYFGREGESSLWRVYFGAEDIDSSAKRVDELGGKTLSEPRDTPWGRVAEAADPQGAMFMMYQI